MDAIKNVSVKYAHVEGNTVAGRRDGLEMYFSWCVYVLL